MTQAKQELERRLVEAGLQRLLGSEAPDLADRIAEVWRRGESERTTEASLPRLRAVPAHAPPPIANRNWLRWGAVAAGLLLTAGLAWKTRSVLEGERRDAAGLEARVESSRRPTLMRATPSVGHVHWNTGEVEPTDEVREGDVVVVESGQASAGALVADSAAGGQSSFILEGPALVRMRRQTGTFGTPGETPGDSSARVAELRLGALDCVQAGDDNFEVHTEYAVLRGYEDAEFRVAIELEGDGPPRIADRAVAWMRTGVDLPVRMALSVSRGEVRIRYGEYEEWLLAGDARTLRTRASTDVSLDDENWLLGLMSALGRRTKELGVWQLASYGKVVGRRARLNAALDEDPRRWDVVEPVLLAMFRDKAATPATERALLDVLAYDSSRRSLELAESLWMDAPETFADGTVLTLAERGGWVFDNEIRAIAESDRAALSRRLAPLAYLAQRGDERAREELDVSITGGIAPTPESFRILVASAGVLHTLGRPAALEDFTQQALVAARDALDRSSLAEARMELLFVEFSLERVERAVSSGDLLRLGTFETDAMAHQFTREGMRSESELRQLLAQLESR